MRKKNWKLILDVYKEVGTYKETAEQLGVHYNTVRKVVKQSKGTCICGNPIDWTRSTIQCSKCLDYRKSITKKKFDNRKEKGVCVVCESDLAKHSSQYCEKHLEAHREASNTHIKKNPQALKQKMREWYRSKAWNGLRKKALNRAEYKCEICENSESRLHVHHVDRTSINHDLSNLIVLCFYCHQTIHSLLKSKNPEKLLKYIQEIYLQ